jgi:hypothetical protein
MSAARTGKGDVSGAVENEDQQPSHKAIDNGNPARFKPVYLVLDDINVDFISASVTFLATLCVVFLQFAPTKTFSAAALILAPLRIFFPRPTNPEGLALITGASSGIGAELTYILAGKGHDLILVGRNEDQLAAVKRNVTKVGRTGVTCHTIATDLSVPGAAEQLYDRVKSLGLAVDILVNGAGLGGAGETLEQSIDFTERMTTLNCTALVQLTQLFGKDMARRGRGWMLQISSVGGKWPPIQTMTMHPCTDPVTRLDGESTSKHLPCVKTLCSRILREFIA